MNDTKKALRAAFPNTIPVLTGYLVLGIAYGILMASKGYAFYWSAVFSIFCFCGSMQFAAITLLTGVFAPFQAFSLSLLVNARHLFYGISLLKKYKGLGAVKNVLIFLLSDETFSIISTIDPPDDVDPKKFYLFISLLDYIYWIAGSVIGGLLGGLISFNTAGLDFALTALFVVLFLEQWYKKENRIYCLIGLIGTVLARIFFGASQLVIPAMGIILFMIFIDRFARKEKA